MAKKSRSPWVDELRDKNGMSTETHMEMWHRLVRALAQGMHNKPGEPKHKSHGK